MEIVTGKISIKQVFIDCLRWDRLYIRHGKRMRSVIVENIMKMMACGSKLLGWHEFLCDGCGHNHRVYHSCKSRFCNKCAKKRTDQWIKNNFNALPQTPWQHITFTMPDHLWPFFKHNRKLLARLSTLAADIILSIAQTAGVTPGIFCALHTFGRDLKWNVHIHLSTTCGGISFDQQRWKKLYFHHQVLKDMWKYKIINMVREQYKAGELELPKELMHIKNYTTFNSWLNFLYQKKWVVHLSKPSKDHKHNLEYLGRYIMRPPIGESRIIGYDGANVSFKYLDHYTNEISIKTLPASHFIGKLIQHIPDKYFHVIRYYGFLSNRVRTKAVEMVCSLLNLINHAKTKVQIKWRDLFKQAWGKDPLQCPTCKTTMRLVSTVNSLAIKYLYDYKSLIFKGII